jgi:Na+-driven multidrug efflux pump
MEAQITNVYNIIKYIEFLIVIFYLIFIFLSIQILLLWDDIYEKELKLKNIVNDSFFKRSCAYIFFFSMFFVIQQYFEGISTPNSIIYYKSFVMLALFSLVLFAYQWYNVLKAPIDKIPARNPLTLDE